MMLKSDKAPDCYFASNNDLGIPTLDLEMQADYVHAPLRAWGSMTRKSRMNGTYHFYIDDKKFSTLWSDPYQLIRTQSMSAVEVNYSTDVHLPKAAAIWGVYRKRWLARYWQSRGLRIFVDLNVAAPFDALNLTGVPPGWSSFATKASDREIKDLLRQADCARRISDTKKITLLVYGGGSLVKGLCQSQDWIHFSDRHSVVSGPGRIGHTEGRILASLVTRWEKANAG